MTFLESVLEDVQFTDAFQSGLKTLSQPFHVYADDEDAVYEDGSLDEEVCDEGADDWGSGVTKVALIYKDYVLKTGYSGYVHSSYNEEHHDFDDILVDDFPEDYCEIEYKIYRRAVEAGISKFFAETISVGNGVYMQERYDGSLDNYTPEGMQFPDWIKQYDDAGCLSDWAEFHGDNMELTGLYDAVKSSRVFAWFVALYSYNDLRALSEFIEAYNINDIHSGNVGWFGNTIKLIDFSGYMTSTGDIIREEEKNEEEVEVCAV